MKKCVNQACEWHDKGKCRLFPAKFQLLVCKHHEEKTEKPQTKKDK